MLTLKLSKPFVVNAMAFTPDGGSLIACGDRGELEVMLLLTLNSNRSLPTVYRYSWVNDGSSIIDIHHDAKNGRVFLNGEAESRCYSYDTWDEIKLDRSNANYNRIVPHPTKNLWATCNTQIVTVRESRPGYYPVWEAKLHNVAQYQFSPDGQRLAILKRDISDEDLERVDELTIDMYDAISGRLMYSTSPVYRGSMIGPYDDPFPDPTPERFHWSSDGGWLATGNTRAIILFRYAFLHSVGPGYSLHLRDFAFHPTTHNLYLALESGQVQVWAPPTWDPIRTFDLNIGPLTALAISPDGTLAAVAGADGQILVWDLDE